MKEFSLGKFFGIEVKLHWTFIVLIVGWMVWLGLTDLPALLPTLFFVFALFGTVLLHELSHSWVALREGVKVDTITLWPIGGVANMDVSDIPDKTEFKIAIAGPLFNIIMVGILLIIFSVFPQTLPSIDTMDSMGFDVILAFPLVTLFWINFMLAAFNLLVPAFPMDGGRVLRSLLGMRMGHFRATQVSVKISTWLSAIMVIVGFIVPAYRMLILIGPFIYLTSRAEVENLVIQRLLSPIPITKILNRKPLVFKGKVTVKDAFSELANKGIPSALVKLDAGYGVVFMEELAGLMKKGYSRRFLGKIVPMADPLHIDDNCADAYKILNRVSADVWPVVSANKLKGVVSLNALKTMYRVRAAQRDSLSKKD